jgi:hypothetical protein
MDHVLDLDTLKRVALSANESDAKTHHTPKALRAESMGNADSVSRQPWGCVRVLASLF